MENLTYERINNLGILKVNRSKFLNALNYQTLKEMDVLLDEIKEDKNVHVLVITGEGEKAFVAGADIKEMKDMNNLEAMAFSKFGNRVFEKIEKLDKVVIGAINGYCLGGGLELALSCDIRIGSNSSKFGQPEVGLGIIPGFGGTQRLFNVVGVGKAKELIFTGSIDGKFIPIRPISDYYSHLVGSIVFGITLGLLLKKFLIKPSKSQVG